VSQIFHSWQHEKALVTLETCTSSLQTAKYFLQSLEMLFMVWASDQDVIQIDTHIGEALEEAAHCPLEYGRGRSDTKW